jgi:hypothetical protein
MTSIIDDIEHRKDLERFMRSEITDAATTEAIDRIARTDDGMLLYRFLQKTLCGTVEGINDGAFYIQEGRRRLAAHLMGLMSGGIEEHARGQCVVFRTGRSDSDRDNVFRPKPGGRRIDERTFVPAYDLPTHDAGPGST